MTEKVDKKRAEGKSSLPEGQDRRRAGVRGAPRKMPPRTIGNVCHDDQGKAVWNWRVDELPRRRQDDPTIDLLKCLSVDGMSIESDEAAQSEDEVAKSFNPYDKTR